MINYTFSIIVPVYNVVMVNNENALIACIDSLINQTYKNIEIILIDDGSRDNAPQICDDYAMTDNRIKVIHKENEGAGVARNLGIKAATGDYVFFVDSDDYIELNSCEIFNEILNKYENIDIISSNCRIYEKNIVSYYKFTPLLNDIPINGQEYLKYQILSRTFPTASCLYIIKRSYLLKYNFFFRTDMVGGEDTELALRLFIPARKVTNSNFEHYNYRYALPNSRSNPKQPEIRSIRFINSSYGLAEKFNEIEDEQLKLLLTDYLVWLIFMVIIKGKLYKRTGKSKINIDFLKKYDFFMKTKFWVSLYSIHPFIYYLAYVINNFRVKICKKFNFKKGVFKIW